MSRNVKIGVIAGVFVLACLILWIVMRTSTSTTGSIQGAKHVSGDWKKNFEIDDQGPRGLYLFTQLLQARIGKNKIARINEPSGLYQIKKQRNTYVLIGEYLALKNDELDTLIDRVNKGSTLLIAYKRITENVLDTLVKNSVTSYVYDQSCSFKVGENKLKFVHLLQGDTVATEWLGYTSRSLRKIEHTKLSETHSLVNLLELKLGKGKVVLLTTPELEHNYQQITRSGFDFTNMILSRLSKNMDCYFIDFAKLNDPSLLDEEEMIEDEDVGKPDSSYFQFVLENPILRTALLLVFFGLLLFLIFRSKRLQPLVPVLRKRQNMTRSFANTISSIYLSKQYPYGLLQLQRKNFYDAVQLRFYIDLSKKDEDRDKKMISLSEKSNISVDQLNDFLKQLENDNVALVDDSYLVTIAKKQRELYHIMGITDGAENLKLGIQNTKIYASIWLSGTLILLGATIMFLGMYMLVQAKGAGILMWPIAAILLFLGIRRINRPVLTIEGKKLCLFPFIGKERCYQTKDIRLVRRSGTVWVLHIEEKEVQLKVNELSRRDIHLIEQYFKMNQIEII